MPQGGSAFSGFTGGGAGTSAGLARFSQSLAKPGFFEGFKNFFKGKDGFSNILDTANFGLNAFGLNKSLGFADDQFGILQQQEKRAADAQRLGVNNSLSLALQLTTPGTPEHAQALQAAAEAGIPTQATV